MTDPSNLFAQWLEASMQSRGLSQAAVAREVGVADAQVSRWRRGQVTPTVRYLQRIADTFGVPRAQLDRMAGYPTSEEQEGGASAETDPQSEAELQAYQARLARLMEERIPRTLWRAYVEACEAMAVELSASFEEALNKLEGEREKQVERAHRDIGFRT